MAGKPFHNNNWNGEGGGVRHGGEWDREKGGENVKWVGCGEMEEDKMECEMEMGRIWI